MNKKELWKEYAVDCKDEWMRCENCRKLIKTKYLTIGETYILCYNCWLKTNLYNGEKLELINYLVQDLDENNWVAKMLYSLLIKKRRERFNNIDELISLLIGDKQFIHYVNYLKREYND